MSNLLMQQNTDLYTRTEIVINVSLSDLEQPIIDVDKVVSYNWQTGIHTTEIRKFLVKELIYEYDDYFGSNNHTLRLVQLKGNQFLKGNKKIGGKEDLLYLSSIDKTERDKVVKQIPNDLHAYAEKELNNKIKSTFEFIISKGVVIDYA